MLTLTLWVNFILSSVFSPPAATFIHLLTCQTLPSTLFPSIPNLPPMWTGRSDLYLSGMNESQVWFKMPQLSSWIMMSCSGQCCSISVADFWKLAQHNRTIYRDQLKSMFTRAVLRMHQPMKTWLCRNPLTKSEKLYCLLLFPDIRGD